MSRDDKTPTEVVQAAFPEPGRVQPRIYDGGSGCAADCACHSSRTEVQR